MAGESGFFGELRRRHVWRVAVAYAVVAWLLVQLASIVFPTFDAPAWVLKSVIVLLVLGFPIALVLAWAFEVTPEGVRLTEPAHSPHARAEAAGQSIARTLNAIIITVLALAVALLLTNQVFWHKGMGPAMQTPVGTTAAHSVRNAAARAVPPNGASRVASLPIPTTAIPEKSVAVLPFISESGGQEQRFFADGLSEDLINALSQFGDLKVISRHSTFQFRNSTDSSRVIGQKLGVAHLLEGTVQHEGDEVRITATLVNAADGSTRWSRQYDRPYQDLFALQDAITQAVADALQAQLKIAPGAVVQTDRPPSGNLAAYTAYQHGIAYVALVTEEGDRRAISAYHEAIRLDPDYAAAYAQLSRTWTGLAGQFVTDAAKIAQAKDAAREASATALQLDPDSSLAHAARADLLLNVDLDRAGAEIAYRRALQLAPHDPMAQYSLGVALASLGRNRQAAALTRRALASDPRHATWYNWLSTYLAALGQLDEARAAAETSIALQPGAVAYHEQLAIIAILRGDAAGALAAASREPPGNWRDYAIALALQIGPDHAAANAALKRLIKKYADAGPYQIAQVYALRHDPDNMFKWLDHAWTNRDPGTFYLLNDPLILRYQHDPRFAAFCKKVGLPTTTDAIAMKL